MNRRGDDVRIAALTLLMVHGVSLRRAATMTGVSKATFHYWMKDHREGRITLAMLECSGRARILDLLKRRQ